MEIVQSRLEGQAEMLKVHDDQLRFSVDRREMALQIEDQRMDAEKRIRFLFVQCEQEYQTVLD